LGKGRQGELNISPTITIENFSRPKERAGFSIANEVTNETALEAGKN